MEVRFPADRKSLDIEGGFLKPGGVFGDESERAESELAAHNQTTAGNHVDEDRKKCNLAESSKMLCPTVGANYRGTKSDSKSRGYV